IAASRNASGTARPTVPAVPCGLMLAAIDGAISATDRPTACHTDSDRRSPPAAGSPAVVPSGRGVETAIGRPPGGRGCAGRRRGGGSVPLNCRFGEICRPRFTTPMHHAGRRRTTTDGGGAHGAARTGRATGRGGGGGRRAGRGRGGRRRAALGRHQRDHPDE